MGYDDDQDEIVESAREIVALRARIAELEEKLGDIVEARDALYTRGGLIGRGVLNRAIDRAAAASNGDESPDHHG